MKSLTEKGLQDLERFRRRVLGLRALGRLTDEDRFELEKRIDDLRAFAIEAEKQVKEKGGIVVNNE